MTDVCVPTDEVDTVCMSNALVTREEPSSSTIDSILQLVYNLRLKGVSEESFWAGVTSFLMFVLFMYMLAWIFRRPKPFLTGLALWIAWFCWAVVYQQKIGSEEIYARWLNARTSTNEVFHAFYLALSAWCHLLAPFLYDFTSLVIAANNSLSWIQRVIVVFACLTAYSIARSMRAIRRHRNNLRSRARAVLFYASFLVVAPLLWWVLTLLPATCYPYLINLVTFVVPVGFTLWTFARPGRGDAVLWLSYWSCAPVLDGFSIFVLQKWPDSLDIQRVFIIAVIWLQVWMGSRQVFHLLRLFLSGVVLVLPAGLSFVAVPRPSAPSWQTMLRLQRLAGDFAEKKITLLLLGIFVIAVASQVLSAISGVLSLAIWVGAALDSERTVRLQLEPLYRRSLAFWILAALIEMLVQIPLVGFWVGMWRPLLLAIFLVQGESVLSTLLFLIPAPRWNEIPPPPGRPPAPSPSPLPGPPPSYEAAVNAE